MACFLWCHLLNSCKTDGMKKIILILLVTLFADNAFAVGKVLPSIGNQTPQVIGGSDPSGNIVPFQLDASGNALTVESFGAFVNGTITVTGNGATQRTQGPTVTVHSCTFQAYSLNSDPVYAGGSTVTNVAGVNRGLEMAAGDGLGPVTMSNLNQIYFAADTANDKIAYFCN